MNRLTVMGRIVRGIELKEVGIDSQVVNNVIAIPKMRANGDSEADFIPFVAWGKRAELLDQYCQKGDLIGLDGRITSRSYEDKEGKQQYVIEMVVDTLTFIPNGRPADEE